jgi:hypothetical protein
MSFSARNPITALEMHEFLTSIFKMREKVRGVFVNGYDGEIRVDLHSQDAETEALKKFRMFIDRGRQHEGTELVYRLMSEFGHGTEPARGDAEHIFAMLSNAGR